MSRHAIQRGRSTDFLWLARSLVRDHVLATVGPSGVMVYVVLASYADQYGHCTLSMALLVSKTGLTPKTIRAGIRKLVAAGLITVTPHPMAASDFQMLPVE